MNDDITPQNRPQQLLTIPNRPTTSSPPHLSPQQSQPSSPISNPQQQVQPLKPGNALNGMQMRPMHPPMKRLIEGKEHPEVHLLEAHASDDPTPPVEKKRKKRVGLWIFLTLLLLLAVAAGAAYMWYQSALSAVNSSDKTRTRIQIVEGSSPTTIGQLLEDKKLIRSHLAFELYTRQTGTRSSLQAGVYNLSPSDSTETIVTHITSGKVDEFTMTFLPGATLAENRKKLIDVGYSADDVDKALKKTYDHPLFEGKPASADLEGYIYGETYNFSSDASVEEILEKTFDQYYKEIKANDLITKFKAQNLTLFQGITLASIIQREVPTKTDQKQVAQVFFTRLADGMELGSDVTYQYAAKKLGVAPTPALDSPYNTRKFAGLPPGPIATPGASALEAVASPAAGDYVYFLSGDDDVTYFARTNDEHEANIRDYCKVKCSVY